MNRHLHYQEFCPGDMTKYHVAYAVAAPGTDRVAHWLAGTATMLFGFNVKSRALRSAILPLGDTQTCDFWTFKQVMDADRDMDAYTASAAYIVYRHLSGVKGTDIEHLIAQPGFVEGWEALLK